jgi:hypothetical protein
MGTCKPQVLAQIRIRIEVKLRGSLGCGCFAMVDCKQSETINIEPNGYSTSRMHENPDPFRVGTGHQLYYSSKLPCSDTGYFCWEAGGNHATPRPPAYATPWPTDEKRGVSLSQEFLDIYCLIPPLILTSVLSRFPLEICTAISKSKPFWATIL